jgi:hypothetical protein
MKAIIAKQIAQLASPAVVTISILVTTNTQLASIHLQTTKPLEAAISPAKSDLERPWVLRSRHWVNTCRLMVSNRIAADAQPTSSIHIQRK